MTDTQPEPATETTTEVDTTVTETTEEVEAPEDESTKADTEA